MLINNADQHEQKTIIIIMFIHTKIHWNWRLKQCLLIFLCFNLRYSYVSSSIDAKRDSQEENNSYETKNDNNIFDATQLGEVEKFRSFIDEKNDEFYNSNKVLVGWPTIPVLFKGSDTRIFDAIHILSKEFHYEIDFIYWRTFEEEKKQQQPEDTVHYDDSEDRKRLYEEGVRNIIDPSSDFYSEEFQCDKNHSNYVMFLFWLWPDGPYTEKVMSWVKQVKYCNALTHIVPAVDDTGIAVRLLYGTSQRISKTPNDVNLEDVENFLLVKGRHPDLMGAEAHDFHRSMMPLKRKFTKRLFSPVYLMQMEMYIYAMADVSLGLNSHIVEYLQQMVPGTTSHLLRYVAPQSNTILTRKDSPTFAKRRGYLFFGYDNRANNNALGWFHDNVFQNLSSRLPEEKLHIAGMVKSPFCEGQLSLYPKLVECHGPLSDEELETLIRSVKVAINPVLEPSGVATKTCRAMILGTPVVVTNMDGTFQIPMSASEKGSLKSIIDDSGAKICNIVEDSLCFMNSLSALLENEYEWTRHSSNAPSFITSFYGYEQYKQDWYRVLHTLYNKPLEIIIDGDSKKHGESMSAQNWHIASTLSSIPGFHVTVMGKLDPSIRGVDNVDTPSTKLMKVPKEDLGGMLPVHLSYESPFLTGFQANLIIRQKWPPTFNPVPLKYCGIGCRVVQIVPWEFGYLPKKWMSMIQKNIDQLWAPSSYNQRVFENSLLAYQTGDINDRSLLVPAGIDCVPLQTLSSGPTEYNNGPITFIFSGGFLPRKGVDIIVQEWNTLFCSNNNLGDKQENVRLILHTSYELGYTDNEVNEMEKIITKCGNIEWMRMRKKWLEEKEHRELIKNADIYIAPFRSEGFGLPIVEAMVMGLSVITSVGGTSADHFMMNKNNEGGLMTDERHKKLLYPVQATETICTKEPCKKNSLCVFSPCKQVRFHKYLKCACEELVREPTWFEVDRDDLREKMLQAYQDKKSILEESSSLSSTRNTHDETQIMGQSFCWTNLRETYQDSVMDPLRRRRKREIDEYLIYTPNQKKLKLIVGWIVLALQISAALGLILGLRFLLLKKNYRLKCKEAIEKHKYSWIISQILLRIRKITNPKVDGKSN